ncbi:hypothetical protein [Bacillus tuaregi]|uniref:hypothetical protein n=1 Tax=Bacillus tuaregi TaxID=1816695 RepID=UPI0008F8ABE8|nr:hypothetical protein [Bacillus tuaregi]
MEVLKIDRRLQLLKKQFQLDAYHIFQTETYQSLHRILNYVYLNTDIVYIQFIDEEILYGYMNYHRKNHFIEISFSQVMKDIKNYLSFLENDKQMKQCIPKVDLSLRNHPLWTEL